MEKKNISRRDFLKGTAAGALSIAAAGVLGACAQRELLPRHRLRLRPLPLRQGSTRRVHTARLPRAWGR